VFSGRLRDLHEGFFKVFGILSVPVRFNKQAESAQGSLPDLDRHARMASNAGQGKRELVIGLCLLQGELGLSSLIAIA
jgi:hypothetical protein